MPTVSPHRNTLIDGMPKDQSRRFVAACEAVPLVAGAVLCEAGATLHHAWFPLSGFLSLLAPVSGHPALEVGLIGHEGMLGGTLALGVDKLPLQALVQGTGTSLRMEAASFRSAMLESPALQQRVNRYLYVNLAQLARSAACTRFHTIETRLARWLLASHDRARGGTFDLTHQFLADMLGVRRSGVTIAAGVLQSRGLIRYARGTIEVLDRVGLELAACECYAALAADYGAVMTGAR